MRAVPKGWNDAAKHIWLGKNGMYALPNPALRDLKTGEQGEGDGWALLLNLSSGAKVLSVHKSFAEAFEAAWQAFWTVIDWSNEDHVATQVRMAGEITRGIKRPPLEGDEWKGQG